MDGGSILPRSILAAVSASDHSQIIIPLLIVFIMMIFSAFFSSAETAYSYCNRIRIKQLAEDGDKKAIKAHRVLENFDRTLVTILIGNNICNTLAASVATILFINLLGNAGSLLSTVVITLVFYVLAETMPKSFAKENCDAYALQIAGFTSVLIKLFTPLSAVFSALSELLKKKISKYTPETPEFTDDDLQVIVESVEEEGGFDAEESDIICSAIEFGDVRVSDVFCPLEKVVSLSVHLSPEEMKKSLISIKYSRIPVYKNDPEVFFGFLRAEEYLVAIINNGGADIKKFISSPMYVSEETRLATVFEDMGKHKCHLAFVRNAERKIVGIITMEDVLEQIVGDINDSDDSSSVGIRGAKQ